MLTLVSTIIIFGLLVTIHEWGHFIVAKRQGIEVEVFSVGFGPVLFKYDWHNTRYCISLFPLGGYVKMAGDDPDQVTGATGEFFSKTPWQRFKVAAAGPVMNYILAFAIFAAMFMVGNPSPTSRIGGVLDGFPAQAAGLQAGDKIVAINQVEVPLWEDVIKQIALADGADMMFVLEREGKQLSVNVSPKMGEAQDILGQDVKKAMVGIKPSEDVEIVKYGPGESLLMAGQKLYMISYLTYKSVWMMLTGQMSFKQSMTGPIGIVFITGETAKKGFIHLLHLMGILSAALALFNFLPIPVLDGGHMVFYLWEMLFKKPISFKVQEWFQQAGMAALLLLMAFVFYNDFVNFKVVDKVKSAVIQPKEELK